MDLANWIMLLSLLYFPASLGLLMLYRNRQQRAQIPGEQSSGDLPEHSER